MADQAEGDLADQSGRQFLEFANLLTDLGRGPLDRAIESPDIEPDCGDSGLLQTGLEIGEVAELGERIPLQSTLDEIGKVRSTRQIVVVAELLEILQPVPVRREEVADESCRLESIGIGRRAAPAINDFLWQLGQGNPVIRLGDLRDSGAPNVAPSPGRVEARSMGGVLHVVGERDDLGIVVVRRAERLRQSNARYGRRSYAEHDQGMPGIAVRTSERQHFPLLPAPLLGFLRFGPECAHQLRVREPGTALAAVVGRLALMQSTASAADRNVLSVGAGRHGTRKEKADPRTPGEVEVVEEPEILKHSRPFRVRHGSPSGSVALAALHERQVNDGFVGRDLIREP